MTEAMRWTSRARVRCVLVVSRGKDLLSLYEHALAGAESVDCDAVVKRLVEVDNARENRRNPSPSRYQPPQRCPDSLGDDPRGYLGAE